MADSQLALAFPQSSAYGEESFFLSESNREAHTWITRWPAWLAHGVMLIGPPGSGKTHLAQMWRARSGGVVLEDADRLADEQALFHLLNRTREQQEWVLLTSRIPVSQWPFTLPDLRSRLNALPVAQVFPPDDALLNALLTKLFSDRQMRVAAPVQAYLCRHMERSFAAAAALVERLDAASLAEGRGVTLPLARKTLENLSFLNASPLP